MKYCTATLLTTAYLSLTLAAPLQVREVPQEHSHERIIVEVMDSLNKDNPKKVVNSVFALLGDKAAKPGAGSVTNLACLQREVADQAFTNAKKDGDIKGMANAILFAGIERNTGSVGKASDPCTDPAVNPEINAMSQHQDPASPGAAEINKKIVLTAAEQLASIGADPQLAAQTATFAPGKIGDITAAGLTCDDKDDAEGCIFTKKLLQVEATPEEIDAAAAKFKKGDGKAADPPKAKDKRHNGEDHGENKAGGADSGNNGQAANTASSGNDQSGKKSGSGNNGQAANTASSGNDQSNQKSDSGNNAQTASAASGGAAASSDQSSASGSSSSGNGETSSFGSCSKPEVVFKAGFDGRKEESFKATNEKDFNHGSTQKLKITSDFICDRLQDTCKAPKETVDKCKAASTSAASLSGQAAADAFNKGIGA